jgi:hypothetical protein
MSEARAARRRTTRRWLTFFTLVLAAIAGASIWTHQWSVALTTLAITAVFALILRGMWRRR